MNDRQSRWRWQNFVAMLAILPATVGHSVVRDVFPDWGFFTRFVVCTGTTAVLLFLFLRLGWWPIPTCNTPPKTPSP